jgi:hypothetical protein
MTKTGALWVRVGLRGSPDEKPAERAEGKRTAAG